MRASMSRILLAAIAVVAIATPTAVVAEASGSCPYHANGDAIPPEKWHQRAMPDDYSGGLKEFSVVYTDRALNHMSAPFIEVMNDLNDLLKGVYNAAATVILPGSGTYGMEAVARQFARGEKALVVRNGYFSYRWTDIFEQTQIASEVVVLKATLDTTDTDASRPHVKPLPIDTIVEAIKKEKPKVVFAPHVETSTGVMFPDDQVKAIADAAHSVGAVFVLDCIASGTYWVDMKALGIDVVITAPQKGWSGHACAGVVMLSARAEALVRDEQATRSDSMTLNLRKWLGVMDTYVAGGFSYYTTMPTDCLRLFRDAAFETREYGFGKIKADFTTMGARVRDTMEAAGLTIVAAPGYRAPGVAVAYVGDKTVAGKFKAAGFQIAAGVPYMLETQPEMATFRFGLFGLDKVKDPDGTVEAIKGALTKALDGVER
jgi:aspartate aminotransferase-like enzyme